MASQNPQLNAADLAAIAKLPQASQITGGINAFNQAAFGNPVPPSSQFGIVPTAPLPPAAPPPAAARPPQPKPQPQRPVGNGFGPGLESLGTVLNPGHALPGAGGGFYTAGPKGDRYVLPVGHPQSYYDKQQANQAAIQQMLGLHPNMAASVFGKPMQPPANHPAPPRTPPVPAQPQHMQAAAQHLGIGNQPSFLGQKFHAPNQPPISVDGLNRVTQAYTTALANNPANHQSAQLTAAAHLDVERALSGMGMH